MTTPQFTLNHMLIVPDSPEAAAFAQRQDAAMTQYAVDLRALEVYDARTRQGRDARTRGQEEARARLRAENAAALEYAQRLKSGVERSVAHFRSVVRRYDAGDDRTLEAEREREIREHVRGLDELELEPFVLGADQRTLRAILDQNPTMPLVSDELVARGVEAYAERTWPADFEELQGRRSALSALSYNLAQLKELLRDESVGPLPAATDSHGGHHDLNDALADSAA